MILRSWFDCENENEFVKFLDENENDTHTIINNTEKSSHKSHYLSK